MSQNKNYSESESRLGDLVEALYDSVMELPLSNSAKNSLVAIMLGDVLKRQGSTISFQMVPVIEYARRVA